MTNAGNQDMPNVGAITELLQQADRGNRQASDQLFQMVQTELRAIAGKRKQQFANVLDASTTGLVDEAFCKIVGRDVTNWQPGDRRKFFFYVANKIHDLLVEAARKRSAQKRGADHNLENIDAADAQERGSDSDFMIDLKSALERLEQDALDECIVFRIRYFLGCTFAETADILELSATEAKRRFRKAQLWLRRELKEYWHDS